MANLSSMPDELLCSILIFLPTSDLLSIARTNDNLNRIACALLYGVIEIKDDSIAWCHKASFANLSSSKQLHENFQGKPELSYLTKTMRLEGSQASQFSSLLSNPLSMPLAFLNLTALTLARAPVFDSNIRTLLSATPNLQTFECDIRWRLPFIECEALGQALSLASRKLVRLRLSIQLVSEWVLREGELDIQGHLGSTLSHFEHLKEVEIPWVVLCGLSCVPNISWKDVLPQGIRLLKFRSDLRPFQHKHQKFKLFYLENARKGATGAGLLDLDISFESDISNSAPLPRIYLY